MSADLAPDSLPSPLEIRSELIATAVKFLKDPQVREASLSKRVAFLEQKGLNRDEIELALARSSTSAANETKRLLGPAAAQTPQFLQQHQLRSQTNWNGIIWTSAVLLGAGTLIAANMDRIKSGAHAILQKFAFTPVEKTEADQQTLWEAIKDLREAMEAREAAITARLTELSQEIRDLRQNE